MWFMLSNRVGNVEIIESVLRLRVSLFVPFIPLYHSTSPGSHTESQEMGMES